MSLLSVKKAFGALPEVYQPIYGHQELSGEVSRVCEDRLTIIKSVADAVSHKLGRPLRILDIGCAQGFISLNLASMGHAVTGIDFLAQNIDVCKALSDENPDLNVSFDQADLEAFIPEIKTDTFDLVLCLSVIHHVAHKNTFEFARDLIRQLSEKIPVGIFELALKEEPLYWNDHLPENYREFLFDYDYTYRLSFIPTHLSDINRPLVYASSQYAYLPGTEESLEICTLIKNAKKNPHDLAEDIYHGTRRYYLTEDDLFIKHSILQVPEYPEIVEANERESKNEAAILSRFAEDDRFPDLIRYDERPDESHLVRKALDGILLSEAITNKTPYDPEKIVSELLDFCVFLEENGLYHSDLRVWNMLLTPEGEVRVIDYGSITKEYTDVLFPNDPVVSLLLVMWEIYNGVLGSTGEVRTQFLRNKILSLGSEETYREIMTLDTGASPMAGLKKISQKNKLGGVLNRKTSHSLLDSVLQAENSIGIVLERENRNRWVEIQGTNHRVDNLENENNYCRQDIAALNIHVVNLWKENDNRIRAYQEQHDWMTSLDRANNTRWEEIKDLYSKADVLFKNQDRLYASVGNSTKVANDLIKRQENYEVLVTQLSTKNSELEARLFELENSKPRRLYVKICKAFKRKPQKSTKSVPQVTAVQKKEDEDLDQMITQKREEVMLTGNLDVTLKDAGTDIMTQLKLDVYREAQTLKVIRKRISPIVKLKGKGGKRPSAKGIAKGIDRKLWGSHTYMNSVRPKLKNTYIKIQYRPINVDYMYDLDDESFVREQYRVFLKRDPGEEEYKNNLSMLKEKKSTRRDMIYAFNNAPGNKAVRKIKGSRYYNDGQ